MNFKQFIINETSSELSAPKSITALKKILDRDCAPFMKEMGHDWDMISLYRGIYLHQSRKSIVKIKVNKNRKPKDIPLNLHKMFNAMFEEEHGVDSIRSESIFATGNSNIAKRYGIIYVIFPIGDYTYWWSPKVADLWHQVDRKDSISYDYSKLFSKLIPTYKNTNLKKGIKSYNEIMILCDNYYAIPEYYLNELIEND